MFSADAALVICLGQDDIFFRCTFYFCICGVCDGTGGTRYGHLLVGIRSGRVLLLIQTGGMGIVTIAVMISRVSGRKIGFRERSTMQTAIAAPQVGGIVRLTGFIFKIMLTIELAGALILMPVFCGDHGVPAGLWQSVFHSISAFCNAGFDLMGFKEPYSSLTSYSSGYRRESDDIRSHRGGRSGFSDI